LLTKMKCVPKIRKTRTSLFEKRNPRARRRVRIPMLCCDWPQGGHFPPNGTRVCVWHKSTMPQGGLGCKKYSFSTEIELTNCRHGRVRIGTALYGFQLTGYGLRVSTSSLTARVGCTPPPTWLPSYRDTPSSVASSSAIWQIVVFI